MSPEQLDYFKQRLEEMLAELNEALETKSEDTVPVEPDRAIGRLSRMDAIQSQQMALGLKARQQQAQMRVKGALEAMRNGHYGTCRRCKGPIAIERLEAQPDAVLCVQCAGQSPRR